MAEEIKPNIKKSSLAERLTTYIFYASVFIFLVAFNFRDTKTNGWLPQYLTSMPSVSQIQFLDSLTGYYLGSNQQIYKTTNGGDNWSLFQNLGDTLGIRKFQFLNRDTIILCAMFSILKSTNGGNSWLYYPFPIFSSMGAYDMRALSMDSIWVAGDNGMNARLYLTTNGGLNWTTKFANSRSYFDKLYFYNRNIGFTCLSTASDIFKTTNGGDNWFVISSAGFLDMYFIDSLNGWHSYVSMRKTTNGGLNWTVQTLPSGGIITGVSLLNFSNINKDTIWGSGGGRAYYFAKGIIYKTTNGGTNWGYQLPDTNIVKFPFYYHSEFFNKNNGWEYMNTSQGGVHTTIGGSDTTFYTAIKVISNNTPNAFTLKQNYPNPFNSSTIIDYLIKEQGWVKLKIFDIAGREMATLVNEVQGAGTYGVPVAVELSSGVYFYRLFFTNKKGEMQFETKKMTLIK